MKLVFYSSSYPFDSNVQWEKAELMVFKQYFDEINVVPFIFGGSTGSDRRVDGIKYWDPIFPNGIPVKKWYSLSWIKFLFSSRMKVYTEEFIKQKVFFSFHKLIRWYHSSFKMDCIADNNQFLKSLALWDTDTVVYFYWGRGASEAIPLLELKKKKLVIRLHGYDLYRERNKGYIPYQRRQIELADYVLPCSDHGRAALTGYYPDLISKFVTMRLGTIPMGRPSPNGDGVFTLLSCSFMVPIKRVKLIVDALMHINKKLRWVHIGDGVQFDFIKSSVKNVPGNIEVVFTGKLEEDQVFSFYRHHEIDLFINVSESEGVPVSIMEAFSAAIPVYATDVGGTSEIVNSTNGKLLPEDILPRHLAQEIESFMDFSSEIRESMKKQAYFTFEEKCNAEKLAHEFAKFLVGKESVINDLGLVSRGVHLFGI